MVNKDLLSKSLYNFERDYEAELREMSILGSNAWQIIKYPLYWKLLLQDSKFDSIYPPIQKKRYVRKLFLQFIKFIDFFVLLFILLKLFIRLRFVDHFVLFYANASDKSQKNENGKLVNFLVDPFIVNGIISKYIYAEKSIDGVLRKPSLIDVDFNLDRLYVLNFINNLSWRKEPTVEFYSHRLADLLTEYFRKNDIFIEISCEEIEKNFRIFFREYKTAKMFLRITKPSFIIASEQLGTGLLKAARDMNIRSIDLQHGIVDRFHPQYIYRTELKSIKNELSIPSYIGVFGNTHKEILMRDNFWSENEIVVLGNSKIHLNRNKIYLKSKVTDELPFILFPTQYTIFNEALFLFNKFIKCSNLQFIVVIKLHPFEPAQNIEAYRKLVKAKPEYFRIAEKEQDIYELIIRSKFVVGFDSAVLLEAVSLYKPCITFGTSSAPRGIHDFFYDDTLHEIIEVVRFDDVESLLNSLNKALDNLEYYNDLVKKLSDYSNGLYDLNYVQNCKRFIDMISSSY